MNAYLKQHLEKYPLMQIEDKIKLLMQGNLGCGHLVKDYNIVLNRLTKELTTINKSTNELIEEISKDYVRVYLLPYYEKYHSFDNLISMFMASSKEEMNIKTFLDELNKLKKFLNDDEKAYLEVYIKRGDFLISHSQIYKEAYNPHYLVIHKKYLREDI